jgi:cobalt-zinc-cadmium efflux system protein
VLITAVAGIGVNIFAAWLISKANRSSLNVEGAYQHILNDLYAFIATAVAGLVVILTGFTRADAIAALVVAALMLKAGYGLVRESGRIFLEAAPANLNPGVIGPAMAELAGVAEIHDLHIWDVTSGLPALSAHVLVDPTRDCHSVRRDLEALLKGRFAIDHTTLQVDHAQDDVLTLGGSVGQADCEDPHGPRHVPVGTDRPAGPAGEIPH